MNAKEEYENFLAYYYFDYNIFSSIISFWENADNTTYQTSYSSYVILNQFYDLTKICIPYSMAHIWDIMNGTKEYENKVSMVNEISKRWYVSEEKDSDLIRVDKSDDVFAHFDEVFQSMKMTNSIRNAFNPLIESAFKNSLLNKQFSGMVDSDLYKNTLNIYKQKKIKSVYDVFQFLYKLVNVMGGKNNLDLNTLSKDELFKKLESFIRNSKLLNSVKVKSLSEFEIFYDKELLNFQQSDFSKKIFMYSFLCDFIGITKEKKENVMKDTFASGMINDLIHLSIGLRCSDFVTNDENLKTKAVFCKKLLDLKVKIFDNKSFCQYLANEYAKIKFPEMDNKEFTISYEIDDKKFQKSFKTDYGKVLYE